MPFITKLDFSDNRQVKQHVETRTVLSGATSFGVPFSALTSGPNLLTSGITQTYLNVGSSFSGNSGTTIYTWYDSRMQLGASSLSALTPSNSGITQNTDQVYTASSTTIIDGNTVALAYTGVSFNVTVTGMTDLGGGNYSGNVTTNVLNILSANTLDFTGRTIWVDVSGITRTDKLIITKGAIPGYVWVCADTEGNGFWDPVSAATSGSSVDIRVTGGTFVTSAGTATFTNNTGGTFSVTGFITGDTYWVSGSSGSYSIHANNDSGLDATANYALAEGYGTLASNFYSHAEGVATTASGVASHAEGNTTTAFGYYSHAEGAVTTASGTSSHSEGNITLAFGAYSHSEGSQSTASGNAAHAEGVDTIASGNSSHAEGSSTKAFGDYSHAEGQQTTANGTYSHAGGSNTKALGVASFVHGTGSTATGTNTIVLGANITGTTDNITYVADLIIDGLVSTDPIATDANGMIVAGTSDARLKKNINELSNSLSAINKLRGVSFEYTEESNMGGGIRYGFIAQEVQKIIPEIVRDRAKGDGMLSLNYTEIIPVLVEAVKELGSGVTTSGNVYLETQTILAEDNDIQLNYSGTPETAIGGGIRILHAMGQNESAELITDEDGNWITNNDFKPRAITIPFYTPTSSDDENGEDGNMTRDDKYLYIRTSDKWKRSNLESF